MMHRFAALVVTAVLPAAGFADPSFSAAQIEFFEKKIRPVLVQHCQSCHGTKDKGSLKLDSRAATLKGGDTGPALVPGDPDRSLLVEAVRYTGDLKMPPKGKLSDEQIADLTAWVKDGAAWPTEATRTSGTGVKPFDLAERAKHWSFRPVTRPEVPTVSNPRWVSNPVDAFILAKLDAAGLKPASPADRRTLIRRLTFDLTGLPPTPAEIEAFLADTAPDAYERLVERLMASPRYGERWGRHWLDLVRFAETRGHEYDFEIPEAWRYRDYVVRALNADLPYDQFVTEHVAGDLVPTPRRHPTEGYDESILGTGFWFLGEGKHSPVDIRLEEAERIDNQIDVFGKTFLGLTLGCARCHDHKFDAISTKDYYALAGYLQSSRYQDAFIDDPTSTVAAIHRLREPVARLRHVAVDLAVRRIETATPTGLAAVKKLGAGRADLPPPIAFDAFDRPGFEGWFVTGTAFSDGPTRGGEPVIGTDARKPVTAVLPPGVAHSGLLSPKLKGVLRSRTFTLDSDHLHLRVAGRQTKINLIIDGFQLIRNPIYGGLTVSVNHGDAFRWVSIAVGMWKGHDAYLELIDDSEAGYLAVERIIHRDGGPPADAPNRLVVTSGTGDPTALLAETVKLWRTGGLAGRSDAADRAAILTAALSNDTSMSPSAAGEQMWAIAAAEMRQAEAGLPTPRRAMAMTDGTPKNERVFIRGNHKTLGDEVPRRFLEALAGSPQPVSSTSSGRLELASRMLAPSNPLLPRVMVNRLWQHHFGEGIVRSPDDFGLQGQSPTHPELLDWLASEFITRGWSLKAMHRLMLMSNTYRMASTVDTDAEKVDPLNKLLHRMPIRRLEAEAIRDAVLAVSGRLDGRMEGRGPLPHLTPFTIGRGRPASGPLDGDGRRSLYLNVRRNFLNPLFLAFDYPVPFSTMGKRTVSNVPAQALAMMNNPFLVQQSALWAKRILARAGATPAARVVTMYVEAFGRPPTPSEINDAVRFVIEQSEAYGRPDDERAWADLGHVLINVKEFVFID